MEFDLGGLKTFSKSYPRYSYGMYSMIETFDRSGTSEDA